MHILRWYIDSSVEEELHLHDKWTVCTEGNSYIVPPPQNKNNCICVWVIITCKSIQWQKNSSNWCSFLSDRLLSVLRGHSFFYPPQRPMTSDFEGFSIPDFIHYINLFSYLNSWERASIFPFECSVLNKGTTGTIFITSLVWRGPWLEIEPGTYRTRSQHYTTRLSRRRKINVVREVLS